MDPPCTGRNLSGHLYPYRGTMWVNTSDRGLGEACRQAQSWVEQGLKFGTIAVNVSALQFSDVGYLDRLLAILDQTRLDPRVLELELTESALMHCLETTAIPLQAIREKGIQISIDDFGTGYSCLSYLQKFPVDILKIDKSFVQEVGSKDQSVLVATIISMARALNLRVVAEGIETREQMEFLSNLACDEGQGFYFSKAVPADAFRRTLHLQEAGAPPFATNARAVGSHRFEALSGRLC